MEELLSENVLQSDLEKFEKQYHQELESNNLTNKAQFEYAWCLVRSQYSSDMKKGILLLEELTSRHTEGNRDYIYYLAIGNARLKQYAVALKYCKAFLQVEPNNQQAISLEEYIKKKMEHEGLKGMAVAGGAALVIGGIVGLGLTLLKK